MQFFILIFHPFDSQTGRSHSPHSRGSLAAASSRRHPPQCGGFAAGTPAKHPPPGWSPPPAPACGGRRAGGGGRGGALHLVCEVVPLLPGLRRGAWAGSPGRRGDPKWQKKGGQGSNTSIQYPFLRFGVSVGQKTHLKLLSGQNPQVRTCLGPPSQEAPLRATIPCRWKDTGQTNITSPGRGRNECAGALRSL